VQVAQLRANLTTEVDMRITLIAKDPDSQPQGSPTLYRTDRGSWVVQGWVVTDPDVLADINLPAGETCVEIPDRMIPLFTQGA
jgi:hypothetical protein